MNAIEEFRTLRNRLADDLAACIAPELRAAGYVDLAIITESDLGRRSENLWGHTSAALRSLYAAEIGHQCVEAGPAIFVCDLTIADAFTRPQYAVAAMIATAIHEVGHLIQSPIQCLDVPKSYRGVLIRNAEHEPKPVCVDDVGGREFPIEGHDSKFIRLTMHLATRMSARGWKLDADRLWHPSVTGLSYGRLYEATLKHEFKSAAMLSLTDVLRLTPPEGFVSLYERDRRSVMESRSEMSFLQKLKRRQQSKSESAEERYRQFAIMVVDDTAPPEDELLEVLRELGKTIDDFEKHVEHITHRRTLKAQADRAGGIRAEMEDGEAKIQELQVEHAERRRIFNEAISSLQHRHEELARELSDCGEAQRMLRQTAPQELKDNIAAIGREIHGVETRLNANRSRLTDVLRPLADAEQAAERNRHITDPGILAGIANRLDALQREVASREAVACNLEDELRTLQERRSELEKQLLHVE